VASFLGELRRRNVVKVSAAYLAAAWLIAQIVETVFPVFELPGVYLRALFVILGLGLPVTIVLAWIYDLTPEGIQRTDDLPEGEYSRRLSGRGLDFTIIGCLSVALLFLILERYYFEPIADETLASIAVLPLATESNDIGSDISYLGEGIADSLIMRLSRISRLKVKSRSMIRQADEDVREIGEMLGVDAVVMGRLTQREDVFDIVVELVDTVDGSVMWSNRFMRRAVNLISIETEVSAEISKALSIRLSLDEEADLARPPTDNAAAYRLYLKGRYFWNQRSEDGLRRSADLFQEAIELDPDYALAWSGLADSYFMLFAWGIEPPQSTVSQIRSAAQRAIELDPSLAEPHATLAYLKTIVDWDWEGAERDFLTAIELNENYSTAHHWYAFYLLTVGESKAAIEEVLKARDSEPLSPIVNSEVSYFYVYDGQYDKAIEELHAASLISPGFPSIRSGYIRAYALNGQIEEAIEIQQSKGIAYGDSVVGAGVGMLVLPTLGLDEEARDFYEYALKESETRYVMPGMLGMLAASIGEADEAFAHFDQALDERSLVVSWLRDPFISNIRDDPRYPELFERVGLTR
jgi:TolB-like protein/Tfp pilus assembly protein PilF